MGKLKIYELAKELNLTSKDLISKAEELGIKVKSHLSSLEDDEVEKLRNSFAKKEGYEKAMMLFEHQKANFKRAYDPGQKRIR